MNKDRLAKLWATVDNNLITRAKESCKLLWCGKTNTQDSGSVENHATVVFTVNVYSNKSSGKKSECKAILSYIDDMFINLGFARTMKEHITMNNATVCRMIARYTATVSKNLEICRR